MDKNIQLTLFLGAIFFLTSCATSMSPAKIHETLPTYTNAEFLSQPEAEKAINTNRCKYLVRERSYTAPIGLTVKGDLKKGAKGIDEWVELDGGNAYSLVNYKWETIDDYGTTQLKLDFNTMLCE